MDIQVSPQSAGTQAGGPLDGIRVLEVGSLIAGPFAGRLLAEFGAEVIKIEAPHKPDPLREWGLHPYHGHMLWWAVQSRNKKCVTLDLRQERGQELFRELARDSDVVLENFRPGTMERWGLGWEQLHELNPRLVMARVSGFGQTGPRASRGGFAAVAEAIGGLRYINGYPDEPPPRTGISLGDSLAALFALEGVLSALYWRDTRGGEGQLVDVALTEACFALLESAVPEYALAGYDREPQGSSIGANVPSNIFRSRDGRWVVIAANVDGLFRRLMQTIGRPELSDDARFADHRARTAHKDEIEAIIADWARTLDADEIDRVLAEAGIPCGPVNRISDIFADPQFRARDMLVPMHDEALGDYVAPGVVPKLSATPGRIDWPGPEPGSHNREVFGEILGLGDGELAELAAADVV
jgi:crotonobetainyl-CoA:carnitine CoA-transferase CaiB-like acyl-CoA transferase